MIPYLQCMYKSQKIIDLMKTIKTCILTVYPQSSNLTFFQSYTLPFLHSSNLTLFQSYTLPNYSVLILLSSNVQFYTLLILHSSNLTLFQSTLFLSNSLPIIHSSNLTLFQSYIPPILHSYILTL